MRKTILATVLFMTLSGASALCAQSSQGALEAQRAWLKAYCEKDAGALEELLADDFILIGADGSHQSKQAFLSALGSGKAGRPLTDQDLRKIEARMHGCAAVLTGETELSSREAGVEWQVFERGKTKHMKEVPVTKTVTRRYRLAETWVESGGRWKLAASALIEID